MIRTLLSIAAIVALLQLAGTLDAVAQAPRPVVLGLLQLVGIEATAENGALRVGALHVPWSRDCAGLSILAVLWAAILWSQRLQPLSGRLWRQLLAAVPLAFVANVARILTIIAYRAALYPRIESPQLHYFIGFLWVLPILALSVRGRGDEASSRRLELVYIAAALSLMAPQLWAPGGTVVTIASLLILAGCRLAVRATPTLWLATAAWLLAAVAIALGRMESLWLPWLLVCPWLVSPRLLRSARAPLLLLATVPVVVQHPLGGAIAVAGIAWQVLVLARGRGEGARRVNLPSPVHGIVGATALAASFALPFVAAVIAGGGRPPVAPPAGAMTQAIDANSHRVRLVGQARELEVIWFGGYGDGRHHSLPVCMRYRGVTLQPTAVAGVSTDGERWMAEFFLLDGELLRDYPTYLRRTFLPFTPPGVHVVAAAPTEAMTAPAFAAAVAEHARDLHRLQLAQRRRDASDPWLQANAARR